MKVKRLLSGLLALVMVLTATILPASAATTFPDIQNHWAKSYIEAMTAAGMFKGYEDGNFKPENQLTTAEALALCARTIGLDSSTTMDIATDYYDTVKTTLNNEQTWFYQEFSICLATGILTTADLKSLYQSGDLTDPIAKEDLAVYLVRAMQLGPMAERLTSYPLTFDDASSISADAKPSVYLLHVYGIVEGDEFNDFSPKLNVTRAVMATMLTRAIAYMQAHGTSPDLPEYTDYAFRQGVISSVSTTNGVIQLSLNSDLTGAAIGTVTLPANVTIYENNMETTSSALKNGRHARVCLDSSGTPFAVRVSGELETFTATVNGIDGKNVAVTADGTGRLLTMDRFTQVQIGTKTTGDYSIVESGANYTTAVCKLDDQGRLVAIQFTGGTSTTEGIFADYTKSSTSSANATIQLIGFDGVTRTYTIPSDATITVDGLVDSLSSSLKDSYVILRLLDEDASVQSVSVDTKSNYVQGVIKSVDSSDDTISITRLSNDRTATYDVTSSAVITYDGETTRLKDLDKNDFVTILLNESDDATMIQAYPSSTTTEGTISERTFGSGTDTTITFVVTQKDGTKVSFKVDLSDPPVVERDDEDSTVDKLRVGDEVEFTVRYGDVTRIEATTQNVNLTGTVERIIQEKSGYTLEMLLSDGEEVSYTVDNSVSVTQNNKEVALSSLKPGYKLGLAVNGDQVVAIEIQQAVNTGNKVSGTILWVDYAQDLIYLRATTDTGSEEMVTVEVPSSAVILNASTGKSLVLRDLDTGNVIEVNGSYSGTIFEATIILRQ
ncbi:S-layer homology domain-containing protein [Intestinimonas timonensis]|uniref:S-layer homology domain-containing protein n=1 Tax=Intestinimonas timonensis TaxID=1689270 RepID=UPI0023F57FE6|nr:S-layer homology domain-containing protein [Intestinimonas timonensis]